LQQLRPNGIMVIPVGPPGQLILKIVKQQGENDSIRVARSNVYNKPFSKLDGEAVKGIHGGRRRG
jgi:protein-L-isoaspartate(D-aspartate) O-methyltransferase